VVVGGSRKGLQNGGGYLKVEGDCNRQEWPSVIFHRPFVFTDLFDPVSRREWLEELAVLLVFCWLASSDSLTRGRIACWSS